MMSSTCYSFGGSIFLQKSGAGIGLRGSAAQAKVTMAMWDRRWASVMSSWSIIAQIFIRYIDDMRILLHPIKRGWKWSEEGWQFDPNSIDERDPITRTCDELRKSFESLFDFLGFTTENELDFENSYLPTLDVETKVAENGTILYRFYSKPMSNNVVIQNGTALSQDIVFSSLRQEVIRRMSNTCEVVPLQHRIKLLEDFIQLMVNSGHKFTFIKSVLLQGLTKYKYMVWRNKLSSDHDRYMPLHRSIDHRRHERLLIKYVNIMLWYQEEKLSDPFKNVWKKNIKYRSDTTASRRGRVTQFNKPDISGKKKQVRQQVATVFFVPQSSKSLLFKLIKERENSIKFKFNWGVKILEAAGTPLLNKFICKSPIDQGCPRGDECRLCGNKGIKCSVKSVIYKATCKKCKITGMGSAGVQGDVHHSENNSLKTEDNDSNKAGAGEDCSSIYVGETSRPWRERIREHIEGMNKIKPNSVFVEHWMKKHPLDSTCPEFEFTIVTSYKDALRRQIGEALYILAEGNLNRKTEFNLNELCRMEPRHHTKDVEENWRNEFEERRITKEHLKNFCQIMNNVQKNCIKNEKVQSSSKIRSSFYRSKNPKRSGNSNFQEGPSQKRARKMETSTPLSKMTSYRDQSNDLGSPIESPSRAELSSDHTEGCQSADPSKADGRTQMSGGMDVLELTPPKVVSESNEERNLDLKVLQVTWAAITGGVLKKTTSLPELVPNVSLNCLYNNYPTRVKPRFNHHRHRANSEGDMPSDVSESIDYTKWSNTDFSNKQDEHTAGEECGIEELVGDLCLEQIETQENVPLESEGNENVNASKPDIPAISNDKYYGRARECTLQGSNEREDGPVCDELSSKTSICSTQASDVKCGRERECTLQELNGGEVGNDCDEFSAKAFLTTENPAECSNGLKLDDIKASPIRENILQGSNGRETVHTLVKSEVRYSSIILGQQASEQVLSEIATPGTSSVKRCMNTSPELATPRPRKLSICESLLNGTPVLENGRSRSRLNTWTPSTKVPAASTSKKQLKGGRRLRKRVPDLTNQKLINELFKPVRPKSDDENSKCDVFGLKENDDGVVRTNK